MALPKFSLLVPSFNRPELIRETVESLLMNVRPDVEILVSDDASPKRNEIYSALADLIVPGRIRYLQRVVNLGWSGNRNALINAAAGEYVILLGDDDRLKAKSLERLEKWIDRKPDVAAFGFGYDVIDEHGRRVFSYCTPRCVLYGMNCGTFWTEIFAYDAVPMWSHHPFTMCSKRKVALEIPYNRNVDIADDALYLYDLLLKGYRFVAIPEILFEWRNSFEGGNYRNLSNQMERCTRARGLLLAELASREHLPAEVGSLIRDRQFLRRFGGLDLPDAFILQKMLQDFPHDGARMGDFIKTRSLRRRETRWGKVQRHLRATRVMGAGHLVNFAKFLLDKKRLLRQLKRDRKSDEL